MLLAASGTDLAVEGPIKSNNMKKKASVDTEVCRRTLFAPCSPLMRWLAASKPKSLITAASLGIHCLSHWGLSNASYLLLQEPRAQGQEAGRNKSVLAKPARAKPERYIGGRWAERGTKQVADPADVLLSIRGPPGPWA